MKPRLPVHFFVAFILTFALVCLCPQKASGEETLTFGIHPYLPAEELIKRFTPLVNHIGKELGVSVEIVISRTYEDHIQRVGRNEFDLAYMGPFSYIQMTAVYGKKPILARLEVGGKSTFKGVIFVLNTSDVQTLSGLRGKRFAFGERESTMGYIVPMHMLLKEGISLKDLETYEFITNHNNVALSVLSGDYDAGAIKEDIFEKYRSKGIRALAYTPEVSDHVFLAGTSIKVKRMEKLKEVLLAVGKKPGEQDILDSLQSGVTSLTAAADADYDNLRQIHKTLKNLKAVP